MNEIHLQVDLPTDDNGMVGRNCPECDKYFKVKPGTGLTEITTCVCPYCEHTDASDKFLTTSQIEYIKSIVARQVMGQAFKDLQKSFKELERSTHHGRISIKFRTTQFDLPIKFYSEADLETTVTCDHCGLVFSIYGVFASCPDCARLTAMSMFRNSLESARKRITILDRIPNDEKEIRDALLVDILSAIVATFDGLGKRLQKQFTTYIPGKPRNLFQNLDALSEVLKKNTSIDITNLLDSGQFQKVYYLVQVRHIWNHNFGEADADFVRKTNSDQSILGTKVLPAKEEVIEFLDLVESLGLKLREKLQEYD